MEKRELGIFYFYIHSKMKDKYLLDVITIKELKSFLFEWRIPKVLRPIILKEMELAEMIKKVNRNCVELLDCKMDNINKLYEQYGIFVT